MQAAAPMEYKKRNRTLWPPRDPAPPSASSPRPARGARAARASRVRRPTARQRSRSRGSPVLGGLRLGPRPGRRQARLALARGLLPRVGERVVHLELGRDAADDDGRAAHEHERLGEGLEPLQGRVRRELVGRVAARDLVDGLVAEERDRDGGEAGVVVEVRRRLRRLVELVDVARPQLDAVRADGRRRGSAARSEGAAR